MSNLKFFKLITTKIAQQVSVQLCGTQPSEKVAVLDFVWTTALRVLFRANPLRNWASNPIAPVNRALENEHLSAIWANSLIGLLRKVLKTAKIAPLGHFHRPILTFKTSYSLPKHPRLPYLLKKGYRSAKMLQTFGLKNLLIFPKRLFTAFLEKISDFLNHRFATFQHSYHLF